MPNEEKTTTIPPPTGTSSLPQPPQTPYFVPEVAAFSGASARLPPFYKSNPTLWFLQADAVFSTSRVTSSQIKFQAVVAGLELDVLTQVADLLTISSEDPYPQLRERLVSIYGESESRRITKLLEDTQLGSQRPSQLYRQMLQLAGSTISADVVRTLWLRNLPPRVQEILAATKQEDVEALTSVADKIMEVERPEVYASSTPRPSTSQAHPSSSNDAILEELRKLRAEVADLRRRGRSSSRDRRGNSQQRGRSKSPGDGLCFFHRRFGSKARNCRNPCSWKPKEKQDF